jgi:hypothetical protein
MYAITLDDYFRPSFSSFPKRYYGTMGQIRAFVEALDFEEHRDTVDALYRYLNGELGATHHVAQGQYRLLEPVICIKNTSLPLTDCEWDFINVWDSTYKMRVHNAHVKAAIIKDREQYIRCICPAMEGLDYRSEVDNYAAWHPVNCFWGHPGVLSYKETKTPSVISNLYLPERKYDDDTLAIAELNSVAPNLNIVCEDIFADG